MNEPTARQKGDASKTPCARSSPQFSTPLLGSQKAPFGSSKRIVVSDGVRHEIDLLVTAALPAGYEATFIFECKNWQEKGGNTESKG
jgi:hypothetical protein